MLNSIYTPLSGAIAQEKVLEIIANNLANMSTVGFKGESVTFKLLEPEPEKNYKDPLSPANYKVDFEGLMPFRGNEVAYVGVSGVSRDLSQGSPIETKNPFDLMLEGDGYFSVHTKDGARFTRNGAFSLSREGALVDKQGYAVLGEKGAVFLHGKNVSINNLGEVYQDGEFIDRLQIQKIANPEQMEKVGENHYLYTGAAEGVETVAYPVVKQGYLEASNVNAIKNLTNMILAHRSYEAYQQAIKNYDTMMEKSNYTLAEVRG